MARTKQTARKSCGGLAPRRALTAADIQASLPPPEEDDSYTFEPDSTVGTCKTRISSRLCGYHSCTNAIPALQQSTNLEEYYQQQQTLLNSLSGSTDEQHLSAKDCASSTWANNEQRLSLATAKVQSRNTRAIRVFISSTFVDMAAERELFVKSVFPALRAEFAHKRISISEVLCYLSLPSYTTGGLTLGCKH